MNVSNILSSTVFLSAVYINLNSFDIVSMVSHHRKSNGSFIVSCITMRTKRVTFCLSKVKYLLLTSILIKNKFISSSKCHIEYL